MESKTNVTERIETRHFAGAFEVTSFGGKKSIHKVRTAFKELPRGCYAPVVMPGDVGLADFVEDINEFASKLKSYIESEVKRGE